MMTGEVAKRLGIPVEEVRRLEACRDLPARRTATGRRFFESEDVEAYAAWLETQRTTPTGDAA